MLNKAQSVEPPMYGTEKSDSVRIGEDGVIEEALRIVRGRLRKPRSNSLSSPQEVKDLVALMLTGCEHEQFMVLFLDAQHQLLADEVMFKGTVSQTSVYPREVVKAALRHNASAVILAHNHPSGSIEPSRADEHLTTTLKQALALVDVRVLDHMVVGSSAVLSFAERGLL